MSLACLVSSKESRMAGGMSKGQRLGDEMRLESRHRSDPAGPGRQGKEFGVYSNCSEKCWRIISIGMISSC